MKTIRKNLRKLQFPVHILFPELCPLCHNSFLIEEEPLCPTCMENLQKQITTNEKHCPICLQPLEKNQCTWCGNRELFFARHYNIWNYEGAAKKLLQMAKFSERKKSLQLIQEVATPFIDSLIEERKITNLIYMVSSRKFLCSIKTRKKIHTHFSFFYKEKNIKSKELNRFDRFRVIDKSLLLHKEKLSKLQEGRILIIDDVWTTGASLHHACKLLVEQGIARERIDVISLFQREKIFIANDNRLDAA